MHRRAIVAAAFAAVLAISPWRVRAADPCAAERRRVETLTRRFAELNCAGLNPPIAQCAATSAELAEATAALVTCKAA